MNSSSNGHNLMAKLKPLLALIGQFAEANNQQRDVAPEVVAALTEADLLRCFQPKAWGGYEADPRTLYQLQNQIAQQCPSTAWIFGVLSVQSFVLALMDKQAQADVWGQNPRALMSSSFMPAGKVSPVTGGFRLSGQWSFSSGCNHAQWVMVGGLVPPAETGQPPSMRLFLLPRADYEIVDTWDTFGLRGTGSHDILLADVFIPTYRSFQPSPGIVPSIVPCIATSAEQTTMPPLYRLPWLYVFTSTISNVGVGIAQAALTAFLDIQQQRISGFTGKPAKDEAVVMAAAASLGAEADSTQALYSRHLDTMFACIEENQLMPMAQGLLQRTQLTGALRKLAILVDDIQLLLGGRGIRNDSPLTPLWLDMCAARAHPGNNPHLIAPIYGKALLDKG